MYQLFQAFLACQEYNGWNGMSNDFHRIGKLYDRPRILMLNISSNIICSDVPTLYSFDSSIFCVATSSTGLYHSVFGGMVSVGFVREQDRYKLEVGLLAAWMLAALLSVYKLLLHWCNVRTMVYDLGYQPQKHTFD